MPPPPRPPPPMPPPPRPPPPPPPRPPPRASARLGSASASAPASNNTWVSLTCDMAGSSALGERMNLDLPGVGRRRERERVLGELRGDVPGEVRLELWPRGVV